jgi:hypothetical protein
VVFSLNFKCTLRAQPTLGQTIQTIINEKTNTKKDKWSAQAIK